MHCDDIRDRLDTYWDGEEPLEVHEHLATCGTCSAYHRDLSLVWAGLTLWKLDEAPAPSLGFASRLVRQLDELGQPLRVAEFFERVGRRFVYATLALAMLAILALALPSTGPVHALTVTDIQVPAQEASLAYSDPIGTAGPQETPDAVTVEAPAATNEAK